MKMMMIAALVAAQLSAVASPAQAGELPSEELATQQRGLSLGSEEAGTARAGLSPTSMERADLGDGQTSALRVGGAPVSAQVAAAQEDEPRKRKSTGDKVLTGAAVILGIGALAVGGLLIAVFVN
jgi:hypothetical protein